MIATITSYFDQIKIGVEIALIITIIAGFIHTRLLVRRIAVLKKVFNDFKKMESELAKAVDSASISFEDIRHKMVTGEKRLNSLIAEANNIEDDIQGQKEELIAKEDSLKSLLKTSANMEKAMKEQMNYANRLLLKIEETAKQPDVKEKAQTQSPFGQDSALNQLSQTATAQTERLTPIKEKPEKRSNEDQGGKASLPSEPSGKEEVVLPKEDETDGPSKNPLMQNRPYARR